jgi:hypothetical protein
MISQSAIEKILGIHEKVEMSPDEMVKKLKVSFYPHRDKANMRLSKFADDLKDSLDRLGVEIVPYDSIYERRPLKKRIRRFVRFIAFNVVWVVRKVGGMSEVNSYIPFRSILELSSSRKIKKGICIVCIGEQDVEKLMMQYISSFKDNSIITILDFPENVDRETDFKTHFDVAMKLFAYHMTNIVIGVNENDWIVYNFNASHPIYALNDGKFDQHVLHALIPKIVAPISPHKLEEFMIVPEKFNANDETHSAVISEMQQGALLFDKTGLYPEGKQIDELPFRHPFHRLIGKLHLDNRNGMSFGYLAFQMKTELSVPILFEDFEKDHPKAFNDSDMFVDPTNNYIYIVCTINRKKNVLKVPDIWVMTIRSGADKTHFNRNTDLIKIGLINGKMMLQLPEGLKISKDYKPSFDTKVILAHAVGNAMIASIIQSYDRKHPFVVSVKDRGVSMSHWHGYFNNELLPTGIDMYGKENLHVSCSSPQSAVYALDGKLKSFSDKIERNELAIYNGDVHIEPHHGINITFPSLVALAQYIVDNPKSSVLGNKYL